MIQTGTLSESRSSDSVSLSSGIAFVDRLGTIICGEMAVRLVFPGTLPIVAPPYFRNIASPGLPRLNR